MNYQDCRQLLAEMGIEHPYAQDGATRLYAVATSRVYVFAGFTSTRPIPVRPTSPSTVPVG